MNIAIDGPSGAGKSTIANILSKRLGIVYLDTGAMYRAVGLKAFRNGVKPDDETAITRLLTDTEINVVYGNGTQKILLDGCDVSAEIRAHAISQYASDVSKIHSVRRTMVKIQRAIASKADSVLDGRDIGTYVLPDAEFKFYLTAHVEVRAKRRYHELIAKGMDCRLDDITRDIATRDHNDMTRNFAPLKKADDAVEIDSTALTVDEVVETMLSYIQSGSHQ